MPEEITPTEKAPEIEAETPEIVEEKKEKPWLKPLLFSIFGIILAGGLVFAGYILGQRQVQPGPSPSPTPVVVVTPTPDPTADWKTYNSEIGFSFRYPPYWQIQPLGTTIMVSPPGQFLPVMQIFQLDTNPSFKENFESNEIFDVVSKPIVISGLQAIEYTQTYKQALPHIKIGQTSIIDVVEYKDQPVVLELVDTQYKDTFNLMLSTFKFLENTAYKCVEESSLNCAEEIELSFQCTEEYQSWARENCPGWKNMFALRIIQ